MSDQGQVVISAVGVLFFVWALIQGSKEGSVLRDNAIDKVDRLLPLVWQLTRKLWALDKQAREVQARYPFEAANYRRQAQPLRPQLQAAEKVLLEAGIPGDRLQAFKDASVQPLVYASSAPRRRITTWPEEKPALLKIIAGTDQEEELAWTYGEAPEGIPDDRKAGQQVGRQKRGWKDPW